MSKMRRLGRGGA